MINNKKIIGISPRYNQTETQEYIRVSRNYTSKLQSEDFVPLILVESPNFEDELMLCDAFLMIGGDDVDPKYFGETNDLGLSKGVHPLTDTLDMLMLNHAIKYKKPVLGICRGCQDLAAFMGGTLIQDLAYEHVSHPLLDEHEHYVTKVNNYGLATLLGDKFKINSFHHQAIRNVTDDFVVLFKNDETIEAIEHKTLPFVGVQWHPERYNAPESKIIFEYFFSKIK